MIQPRWSAAALKPAFSSAASLKSLSLSASVASLQKALSQIIYSVNNVDHPVWRFVYKLHFVL